METVEEFPAMFKVAKYHGYDLHDVSNGIPLRSTKKGLEGAPTKEVGHRGPHDEYTQQVAELLSIVRKDWKQGRLKTSQLPEALRAVQNLMRGEIDNTRVPTRSSGFLNCRTHSDSKHSIGTIPTQVSNAHQTEG